MTFSDRLLRSLYNGADPVYKGILCKAKFYSARNFGCLYFLDLYYRGRLNLKNFDKNDYTFSAVLLERYHYILFFMMM